MVRCYGIHGAVSQSSQQCVTVFSPGVYDYFLKLFDLTKKVDFESVLFPLLAQEKRLYSFMIPGRCWLSVNDPKALARLTELVQSE